MASLVDVPEVSIPLVADTSADHANLLAPGSFGNTPGAIAPHLLPSPPSLSLGEFDGSGGAASTVLDASVEVGFDLTVAPTMVKPSADQLPADSDAGSLPLAERIDPVAGHGGDRSFPGMYFNQDSDALLEFETSSPSLLSTIPAFELIPSAIDSPTISPELHQNIEYSPASFAKNLTSPTPRPSQLVVVDGSIADYQSVMDGVLPSTDVLVLDPSRDGIAQISEALAERQDLSSLHIISYGSKGSLQLGSATLDASTLDAYTNQLQSWADALTDTGDILLYGCDVADGAGHALIDRMAQLTGADVAASNDRTGAIALGGDWLLEATTGSIESSGVLTADFAATYRHAFDPPTRVEAEDMDFRQYRIEKTRMASGGEILSLAGQAAAEVGTASLTFTGASGYYDIALKYFDEADGTAALEINHEGKLLDRWTLEQRLGSNYKSEKNYLDRVVGSSVFLKTGDRLEIKGSEQANEHARIDYLEFTATSPSSVNSTKGAKAPDLSGTSINSSIEPPKSDSSSPNRPAETVRLEAETMKRHRYDIEKSSAASGGQLLSLKGDGQLETGTATIDFSGKPGTYDVVVGYFDENDGNAQISLSHEDKLLDRWTLNQQLGTDYINANNRVERTVARNLTIAAGDSFQLEGVETTDEYARIDYIDFIPSSSSSPDVTTPNPASTPVNLSSRSNQAKPSSPVQLKAPQPNSPKPKPPSSGKLLFEDDFENSISNDWKRQETAKKSYSLNVVDAPGGRDGKAARFELHKDDPWVADSKRSELVRESDPAGSERWYGFSIYLPNDWKTDPAGEVVTQWHSRPDKHLGENYGLGGPPLSLMIDGNEMYVQSRWDPSPVTTKQSKTREDAKLWRGSYEKGEWMDWVVQVDWSHQSDGLLRMWKDGELVVDRKGPNTYNDKVGPYFKTGIYKYSWKRSPEKSNTSSRVLYVDNVRVADGSGSFATVDPSV